MRRDQLDCPIMENIKLEFLAPGEIKPRIRAYRTLASVLEPAE